MVKSNCRPSAGGIFRKKVMQLDAWKILRFDTLDSTNTEAKRRARAGDVARTLIIARQQTAGRGRMDRKWVSPMDAGLWMTQLFAPENVRARDASGAVFISAAALSQALRELTGAEVMVKWPNDLVLGGKKICGMLAECGFDGDMCAWIALGSGLNLREDALPPEDTLPPMYFALIQPVLPEEDTVTLTQSSSVLSTLTVAPSLTVPRTE